MLSSNTTTRWADRIVSSPCCTPELGLDAALGYYSQLGFTNFEVFSSWAKSAFDYTADPGVYLAKLRSHGLTATSFHLPPVTDDDGESLDNAVQAAEFARGLGARTVLFKADSRARYISAAKPFLDRTEHLGLVPVLQNHFGTPISTLADFEEVLTGIADTRMNTLLEVGHFHSAGVGWRDGYALLKDTMRLVHIKDQIGAVSVPFGTGEIDLNVLFERLEGDGYRGNYVIEMEVKDSENTARYLADALAYVVNNEPEQGHE